MNLAPSEKLLWLCFLVVSESLWNTRREPWQHVGSFGKVFGKTGNPWNSIGDLANSSMHISSSFPGSDSSKMYQQLADVKYYDMRYYDMRLLHRIEMCADPRRRQQSVQTIASRMQTLIYPHGMTFIKEIRI